MSDILDRAVRLSADVAESPVGGETVLLHMIDGVYFGIDEVGTVIWNLLKAGETPRSICPSLTETYAIELTTVQADVRAFLTELETRGILVSG